MNPFDTAYHNLLKSVLFNGTLRSNRTGINTISQFGAQIRFDMRNGKFPAITTKKLFWKGVVGELLWFLEGSTDERRLAELTYQQSKHDLVDKKTIWTANADTQGVELGYKNSDVRKELGPIYGYQWRHFDGKTDQIKYLLNEIQMNPDSRRLIISSWNPNQLQQMALPPCHVLFQFFCDASGFLSGHLYQRSADVFLGVPFNIASYALLLSIIADAVGRQPGELVMSFGDVHIYENHVAAVSTQLMREDEQCFDPPILMISADFDLEDRLNTTVRLHDTDCFVLNNYQHHPAIQAPMAV